MNEYVICKCIEFITFSSYLIFIFLSIQIWFIWKEIDKDGFKIKNIINESFFKKSSIFVFFFSIFFMIQFLEGTNLPNAMIYSKIFEMLAFISLLLFTYEWYGVLKTCAHKKSLPQELTYFGKRK